MTIVARACAEFHDRNGAALFTIRPHMLGALIYDVPDSIRQDPLFGMLVHDRLLDEVDTKNKEQVKKLENDPGMFIPSEKAPEAEKNGSAAPADEKKSGRKSAENK